MPGEAAPGALRRQPFSSSNSMYPDALTPPPRLPSVGDPNTATDRSRYDDGAVGVEGDGSGGPDGAGGGVEATGVAGATGAGAGAASFQQGLQRQVRAVADSVIAVNTLAIRSR